MTLVVPNLIAPFLDKYGVLKAPWPQFFQQFTDTPSNVMSAIVSASPFSYQAGEPGTVFITGGTVSLVQLIRGSTTINVGTLRAIIVSRGDIIKTTYTVAPTIQFVPFYSTPR